MSLYEMFETNADKEANGVEIEIGTNKDGSKPTFIIGAMYKSNPKYMKALERVTQEYKAQLQNDALSVAQAEEINMLVFVETVLFGWKNVFNKAGEAVKFTKEAAIQLFTDLPRLYDLLVTEASKTARFRVASMESDAGN